MINHAADKNHPDIRATTDRTVPTSPIDADVPVTATTVKAIMGLSSRRLTAVATTFVALLLLVPAVTVPPAHAAGITVQTLHFRAGGCDVIGDLYTPSSATADHPAPAILTTNGFGGSKESLVGTAKMFARHGYVVLAYSGLGFGGSGCRVTLDSPAPDGRAASDLISFLGGADRIAYRDAAHRRAAPRLTVVKRDTVAADGLRHAHDPRVGMVGGSYGGQIQFAAASVDPRLDTITPMVTWNDLSYSMYPNSVDQVHGVTAATPGATKINWGLTFGAAGVGSGVAHADVDTARLTGCPNFPREVCDGIAAGVTSGVPSRAVVDRLRAASVASYLDRITIPTLIVQGQKDTLFNLNESLATFRGLRARGVPTSLIWFSGGHSGDTASGDFVESAPDPSHQYIARRLLDWTDHYLKDSGTATGPTFTYYRDWVRYTGDAAPAYAAGSVDAPATAAYRLSGEHGLVSAGQRAVRGSARFTTPPLGLPSSSDEPDGLGLIGAPERDVPGTYVRWDTAPLSAPQTVVGSPTVTVRLHTTVRPHAPVSRRLVVFARIVDVAPNGRATTVGNLVAPARIADPSRPVTITVPAMVHRFASGHRIRLVISGGSTNYRGALTPMPVRIDAGPHQKVTLPVTSP